MGYRWPFALWQHYPCLNHLYIPSGMCCPLILTEKKQWVEQKVQTEWQDPQNKEQKDRMTKEWERRSANGRQDVHE
jgi:hypothetical protein